MRAYPVRAAKNFLQLFPIRRRFGLREILQFPRWEPASGKVAAAEILFTHEHFSLRYYCFDANHSVWLIICESAAAAGSLF